MIEVDAARYARQMALDGFGLPAQQRLERARVLVVGAGGLGSTVIPALAAAGVGTIGVIDEDTVEQSNLPRQTLFDPSDLGRPKVRAAAERIARLNPAVRVEASEARLTAANALELVSAYDVVVDGSDNFPTRYLTDDAATLTGVPCVWGAVHQYSGQAGLSWSANGPTYRDLFPEPPAPGTVGSCETDGVLPTVCAMIGSIMASEVIKLVTGIGEPLLGRVLTYDARAGDVRALTYERDPLTAPVLELIDYEAFCGFADPGADARESEPRGEAGSDSGGRSTRRTERDSTGIPAITVAELAEAREAGRAIQLVDVREEWEAQIASLPGSTLIPLGELGVRAGELDSDAPTVLYCHAGPRSDYACQVLSALGFTDVRSLRGGIDEWSRTVDPSVARY